MTKGLMIGVMGVAFAGFAWGSWSDSNVPLNAALGAICLLISWVVD